MGKKWQTVELVAMRQGKIEGNTGQLEILAAPPPEGLGAAERLIWSGAMNRICELLGKSFASCTGGRVTSFNREG